MNRPIWIVLKITERSYEKLASEKIGGNLKFKMQKLRLLTKLQRNESFKAIVDWRVKNEFLKNQIIALEKTKEFPIFSVLSFLLKTQLVEFELKQLITSLDLHLYFSNTSKVLKIKTRTPKDMDERRMTLGNLKNEIYQYEGKVLENLQEQLSKLVGLRNDFVHKLFNPGSISELIGKSDNGLKIATKVLKEIESVEKFLKENDPLKIKK